LIKTHDERTWESRIQEMFSLIAPHYDLMNYLITAGQDKHWKREVIRQVRLPSHGWLLDLGAGTGDLARSAHHQQPKVYTIAADFTLKMMQAGRRHPASEQLNWCATNAMHLPFPESTFDAVVSGFLLRNVSDLLGCLKEQHRVLKPGGRLIALDTTPPARSRFTPLVDFHLNTVIPAIGGLVSGNRAAYTYLPESTKNFLNADKLAESMDMAGFKEIGFRFFMFGTIAMHWCKR
jgi:demethylmenaquinone methyltransferase/2-methoxy-6-polyprenyl-1,4-benzoquinol methylase